MKETMKIGLTISILLLFLGIVFPLFFVLGKGLSWWIIITYLLGMGLVGYYVREYIMKKIKAQS